MLRKVCMIAIGLAFLFGIGACGRGELDSSSTTQTGTTITNKAYFSRDDLNNLDAKVKEYMDNYGELMKSVDINTYTTMQAVVDKLNSGESIEKPANTNCGTSSFPEVSSDELTTIDLVYGPQLKVKGKTALDFVQDSRNLTNEMNALTGC